MDETLSEMLDVPIGDHLIENVKQYINEARISSLKRFSHVPAPHDEEWSEEFQKGVEHGVRVSQEKLRFEIQRLKKCTQFFNHAQLEEARYWKSNIIPGSDWRLQQKADARIKALKADTKPNNAVKPPIKDNY